jgi:hypothetical protein
MSLMREPPKNLPHLAAVTVILNSVVKLIIFISRQQNFLLKYQIPINTLKIRQFEHLKKASTSMFHYLLSGTIEMHFCCILTVVFVFINSLLFNKRTKKETSSLEPKATFTFHST